MICKRNLQFSGSISIKSGQRQEYSDQELSGAISKSFIVKVAPVFTYLFIYIIFRTQVPAKFFSIVLSSWIMLLNLTMMEFRPTYEHSG